MLSGLWIHSYGFGVLVPCAPTFCATTSVFLEIFEIKKRWKFVSLLMGLIFFWWVFKSPRQLRPHQSKNSLRVRHEGKEKGKKNNKLPFTWRLGLGNSQEKLSRIRSPTSLKKIFIKNNFFLTAPRSWNSVYKILKEIFVFPQTNYIIMLTRSRQLQDSSQGDLRPME